MAIRCSSQIQRGGTRESILYDAGFTRTTATHNLDVLGLRIGDLRAVVLSHGHADHHGGMAGMVSRVGRRGLPLVLHPDAWLDRKIVFPDGREIPAPPPSHKDLDREGVTVVEERGPTLLVDGCALVTGQVDRTTDFEPGFPIQYRRSSRGWEPDYMVWDDQGVIVHVRGKGLVVMSSCSHSGVINVLRNARRLTGIDRIHAFVGGCHLSGAIMEPLIPRTLEEMRALRLDTIVPGSAPSPTPVPTTGRSSCAARHLAQRDFGARLLPKELDGRVEDPRTRRTHPTWRLSG